MRYFLPEIATAGLSSLQADPKVFVTPHASEAFGFRVMTENDQKGSALPRLSDLDVFPHLSVLGQHSGGVERSGGHRRGLLLGTNARTMSIDKKCAGACWGGGANTYADPGVFHKLTDGHPLVRVRLQQLVNQTFACEGHSDILVTPQGPPADRREQHFGVIVRKLWLLWTNELIDSTRR